MTPTPSKSLLRLLILGAGSAGTRIARELLDRHRQTYQIIGFLDDDLGKLGTRIEGIPVLGPLSNVTTVTQTHQIDLLLLAIPSLSPDQRDRVIREAKRTGIPVRSLPALSELLSTAPPSWAQRFEPIDYAEFLNRPVVASAIIEPPNVRNEDILVTGAAGTIGSELCRHLLDLHPRTLFLLDCAETPLYLLYRELESTLLHRNGSTRIVPLFCDLTWPACIANIMQANTPTMVFHAAAYKHVPACEWSPSLAVRINVLATWHLLALVCHYRVRHFTLISTDKAVSPTTVLGMTKRLAEYALYEHAAYCTTTRFNAVRFGNVLGSNGSVIPLFLAQIERGGPVTITHREATRYFMTVQEAVMLVVQAACQPECGTLSILDMGAPVKILDLAMKLIERKGYRGIVESASTTHNGYGPCTIPIVETGLRPGEKLHEALWDSDEELTATSHPKIFQAKRRPDSATMPALSPFIKRFHHLVDFQQDDQLRRLMRQIIPTATAVSVDKESH
jgi:FlaA1/EpsC-like NDP-sugar epimerase